MEKAGDFLVDSIADAVVERLFRMGPAVGVKRLYSTEEASIFMGWSEDALRDKVNEGQIIPVRPTRKVQYDVVELWKYIDGLKRAI